MLVRTQTRTHTHTHPHTHTHTHTHKLTYAYKQTYGRTRAHTHAKTYIHYHEHTRRGHTVMHWYARTQKHISTHISITKYACTNSDACVLCTQCIVNTGTRTLKIVIV